MLRLLGFIVGCMLTALVLFDLDPHEALHRGEALVAEAQERLHAVREAPLPEVTAPEASETEPTTESSVAEMEVDSAPEAGLVTIETTEEGTVATDATVPDGGVDGPDHPAYEDLQAVATQAPAGGWQPLWRPFRSELSARGFADQIAEITGRETRVRRLGPRSHQVDVAFADETQRRNTLQRLELLTGIELREEGS